MDVFCLALGLPPDSALVSVGVIALSVFAVERIVSLFRSAAAQHDSCIDPRTVATQAELTALETNTRSELVAAEKRITKLEQTLASEMQSISRALGRIEGELGIKSK